MRVQQKKKSLYVTRQKQHSKTFKKHLPWTYWELESEFNYEHTCIKLCVVHFAAFYLFYHSVPLCLTTWQHVSLSKNCWCCATRKGVKEVTQSFLHSSDFRLWLLLVACCTCFGYLPHLQKMSSAEVWYGNLSVYVVCLCTFLKSPSTDPESWRVPLQSAVFKKVHGDSSKGHFHKGVRSDQTFRPFSKWSSTVPRGQPFQWRFQKGTLILREVFLKN